MFKDKRVIVKVEKIGDEWHVQGKGRQNLRIVPDERAPPFIRGKMKDSQVMFCKATWDRAKGQWQIGDRVGAEDW